MRWLRYDINVRWRKQYNVSRCIEERVTKYGDEMREAATTTKIMDIILIIIDNIIKKV